MTRDITEDEFLSTTPETLAAVRTDSFVISKAGNFVAALVGEQEYLELRKLRAERVQGVLGRFHEAIAASGASQKELVELEKALDRHAT